MVIDLNVSDFLAILSLFVSVLLMVLRLFEKWMKNGGGGTLLLTTIVFDDATDCGGQNVLHDDMSNYREVLELPNGVMRVEAVLRKKEINAILFVHNSLDERIPYTIEDAGGKPNKGESGLQTAMREGSEELGDFLLSSGVRVKERDASVRVVNHDWSARPWTVRILPCLNFDHEKLDQMYCDGGNQENLIEIVAVPISNIKYDATRNVVHCLDVKGRYCEVNGRLTNLLKNRVFLSWCETFMSRIKRLDDRKRLVVGDSSPPITG
jgi:hypothetical protein